jgi:hypothetical protein
MVDPVDTAQEHISEAHAEHGDKDPWPRRMAVAVSFLAAGLALAEIGEKATQTAYLTHHIAATDTWNFYQAKNLRAGMRNSEIAVLESLPNADTPAVQARIAAARAEEARMHDDPATGEGMKQLRAKAIVEERDREQAFHAYHGYEYTSGALEISIVLASVSVVTRMRPLGIAAGLIGLAAFGFGLAVYSHLT